MESKEGGMIETNLGEDGARSSNGLTGLSAKPREKTDYVWRNLFRLLWQIIREAECPPYVPPEEKTPYQAYLDSLRKGA